MRYRVLISFWLALLFACAPSEDTYADWQIAFDDPGMRERATLIQTRVLRGGCTSGGVVYEANFAPYERAAVPPPLDEGRYGFVVRARDESCNWFAVGCEARLLPSTEPLTVTMMAVNEPAVDEACEPAEPLASETEPPVEQDAATPTEEPPPLGGTPCSVSGPGLVACFEFEDDLRDGSGLDNHAQSPGATFEPGVTGNAVRVGTQPIVVSDHQSLDMSDALTIETWIHLDSLGEDSSMLVDNDSQYYLAINADGSLEAGLYAFGVLFRYASSAGAVQVGRWSHVAMTFDGLWVTLYQDGAMLGTMDHSQPIAVDSDAALHIGSASPAGTRALQGRLDGVRIWSVARSGAELCESGGC